MKIRSLTALPVYNEVAHVGPVLDEALRYGREVLAVDDGSTDGTSDLLAARGDIHVIRHPANRGYGAALQSAFDFAVRGGYDVLVTIDCDGQHQPKRIPQFVQTCLRKDADVVSGSRYLRHFPGDSRPPEGRRRINREITDELNRLLGLGLTDAFCGFKAYQVPCLAKIELTETGYAMPLEFWVRAAELGLRIVELPVPLIYLDEARSFGGSLDDAQARLAVYRDVIRRSMNRPCTEFCAQQGRACVQGDSPTFADTRIGTVPMNRIGRAPHPAAAAFRPQDVSPPRLAPSDLPPDSGCGEPIA